MRIAVWIVGSIVGLVVLVLLIGWSLPVGHHVSREASFDVPSESLFALISSPADFPHWKTGVKSVEVLPDEAGHARFREVSSSGAILYDVDRAIPGKQWVTRIADKSLPFGGTWTYDLIPNGEGTTLRITEDGEVYNPLFRFVSRYVMGQTATMDQYLADAHKRFATR
jgi:hypothetical protein